MTVDEYKAHIYALSRHAIFSISIKAKRIIKLIKGLITSLQVSTTQLVTVGGPFRVLWIIIWKLRVFAGCSVCLW